LNKGKSVVMFTPTRDVLSPLEQCNCERTGEVWTETFAHTKNPKLFKCTGSKFSFRSVYRIFESSRFSRQRTEFPKIWNWIILRILRLDFHFICQPSKRNRAVVFGLFRQYDNQTTSCFMSSCRSHEGD
jgi:hypothetical protein